MERINFNVEDEVKRRADEYFEHGELSEELRQHLNILLLDDEVMQMQRVEKRRDEVTGEIRDLEDEIKRLQTQLTRLRRQREDLTQELMDLRDKHDEFEAKMNEILSLMGKDGMRIFEGHSMVMKCAELDATTEADIIDRLRERADESEMHISDDQFTDGSVRYNSK